MTTEYSKPKKPYPDESYTALIDRCTREYEASLRRKRIAVALVYVLTIVVIVAGFWYILK
jgi:hypothetical protein